MQLIAGQKKRGPVAPLLIKENQESVDGFEKSLARVEFGDSLGLDLDDVAGLGIATLTSIAGLHFKGTETHDADLFAVDESLGDLFTESLDSLCGVLLGKIGSL